MGGHSPDMNCNARLFLGFLALALGLTVACGQTVGIGSDREDEIRGSACDPAETRCEPADPETVDAGSPDVDAIDAGGPMDGGAADGGAQFACGTQSCDSSTHYCDGLTSGIPFPDGGAAPTQFACKPYPAACTAKASCACICTAPPNPCGSCSESNGEVTVIRQGI